MQLQDPLAHRKRITPASCWTAATRAAPGDATVSKTSGRLAETNLDETDQDGLKDKTQGQELTNVNFSGFF